MSDDKKYSIKEMFSEFLVIEIFENLTKNVATVGKWFNSFGVDKYIGRGWKNGQREVIISLESGETFEVKLSVKRLS